MQGSGHIKFNQKKVTLPPHTRSVFFFPWSPVSRILTTPVLSFLTLLSAAQTQGALREANGIAPIQPDASKVNSAIVNTLEVSPGLTLPHSVVKFEVPIQRVENGKRRNFIENCTAYAVHKTPEHYLFLSSWHCIDGYKEGRNLPSVYHATNNAKPIVLESGGSMNRDWLLMMAPKDAFGESLSLTPPSADPVKKGETLYGFGWGGYEQRSESTLKARTCKAMAVGAQLTLGCVFVKGDSGGLIARKLNGKYEAVGIISAGDSSTVTYAYPIATLPSGVSSEILRLSD